MEQFFRIGAISSIHGLKGEVKVYPLTDPERFDELSYVLLETGRERIRLEVERVRWFKNLAIIKFAGLDDISQVEKYRGKELWIPREDAQKLGENEYYIGDLIGMQVVTEEDLILGTVSDVLQTGANDVYVVSSEGKKDLLLPAVRQCILSVDVNKNRMTVRLMKGMEP